MLLCITLCAGKSETDTEKLRSIPAQLEYQFLVGTWKHNGVPFKSHLHVPESHPATGAMFCEREDEGHVLKVCTYSLCNAPNKKAI